MRVANRTSVLVVQHPRERTHPFNTARLLELCLDDVQVVVDFDGQLRRGASPLPLQPGAALLYPSPRARELSALLRHERPRQLVVIDGTWHHAHTLYRDIPGLESLPHVTLPPGSESEFLVRRQPAAHCLSTLEAVQRALDVLEPETAGLTGLLDVFRSMNLGQAASGQGAGRVRKRYREQPRLPRALAEDYADLVVAYAETAPAACGDRVLLSLSAERLATGERFDCVLQQAGVLDAHLAHMGLEPGDLRSGSTLAAFRARWAAFLGPTAVLGVWSHTTLDALSAVGVAPARSLVLKAAYRSLRAARGGMDDVAAREGRASPPPAGPRRHERLANAAWVARALRERPSAPEPNHSM